MPARCATMAKGHHPLSSNQKARRAHVQCSPPFQIHISALTFFACSGPLTLPDCKPKIPTFNSKTGATFIDTCLYFALL